MEILEEILLLLTIFISYSIAENIYSSNNMKQFLLFCIIFIIFKIIIKIFKNRI